MNVGLLLDRIEGASLDDGFEPVTVDVPAAAWASAVTVAKAELGCSFFDFLTAVDDPVGIQVVCHLAVREPFGHLIVRTTLGDPPRLGSVASLFAGAAWHERETAEMFGVVFLDPAGEPVPHERLLLPPTVQGHPLRKDFELASRVDRPWPGDTEPRA